MMLPYVTPPAAVSTRKIGSATSGVIEMEVRGGLTVGESSIITELLASDQSTFVRGSQIADRIAKEEEISSTEAFRLVEDCLAGRALEEAGESIRVRHAAQIEELGRLYAQAGQRNIEATVTALIRSRCKLPGWGISDTQGLHKSLVDGIWQLALDEQEAEKQPATPPTEEDLGKLPPDKTAVKPSTGKKSSGN